jgi:hypothetical protein
LSFVQIKTLPFEHDCPTTKLVVNKMPSQDWVSDRLKDWLKKNPSTHPKTAKEKVETDYGIKIKWPDRADWPEVELGYKLHPPLQKRAAGGQDQRKYGRKGK